MEESTLSGGLMTATSTPALDAARAELTEIATNPANPRHAGYHRGDPQVSAYLDQLYKQAVPPPTAPDTPTEPAPRREPDHPDNPMSLEDRAAQTQVEEMLRHTLGEDYDREMSDMRIGAAHLFSMPEGEKVLAAFSPLITALGPLAEVRSIRFLAELGQLIKTHKGDEYEYCTRRR